MQTLVRNVLLLEDETIIAIDIEDTLRGFGAGSIHTSDNAVDALEWLRQNEPSVAIIDPRLKDGYCGNVVRNLVERGIPFVVYSSDLGAADVDVDFDKGVWLTKPAAPEAMRAAIATFAP